MIEIKTLSEKEILEYINSEMNQEVGYFVEYIVKEALVQYVPPAFLYSNPQIRINEDGSQIQLTDIAFFYKDFLLLIECKGRRIENIEVLNNYLKLDRWLDKQLSISRKQLIRSVNLIKQNPLIEGVIKNCAVLAHLGSVKNIILINILYTLKDFYWRPKVQERKIKYPEIQIFDLRAFGLIANYFKVVDEFLNYLFERYTLCKKHPQFIVYEDNLLSYFLNNNKSFITLLNADASDVYKVFLKN
jgi:hypothetical protein